MQIETINWPEVIGTTAKLEGIAKMEVMRRAGVGGGAAINLARDRRVNEPHFSEGKSLLDQFHNATGGKQPPVINRKARYRCNSCQASYPVENIYRVSVGVYKCDGCIKRIAIANQKKHKENKKL